MPRPPAEFELIKLYKGKVQIRFYPKSHTYKVLDGEYGHNWETCPSVTGIVDQMAKGGGLMAYAMSEAMKYMDQTFKNKSLRQLVDDPKFEFKTFFQEARKAHIEKSNQGKRIGTAAHSYFEQLLVSYMDAQNKGGTWKVPLVPRAIDLKEDLRQSWLNIIEVQPFATVAQVDRYRETVDKDIRIRMAIWDEALKEQRACQSVREFFLAAAKAQVLKVWGVEQMVYSRTRFVIGRFDAILEFVRPFVWNGYTIPAGVYVSDLKTSNASKDYPMGIYPNHLCQMGGYDVLYTEEYPGTQERFTGHLALGSAKDGSGFHPYASLQRERNCEWFKALRPVAEYMHQADKELKGLQLYGGEKGKK